MLTYNDLGSGVWACEWSPSDEQICYAGLRTGQVLKYDLRNTSRALKSFSLGRRQPIHSIRECNRGLFVGKVGGVEFWKQDQEEEYHMFEENEMLRGSCSAVDMIVTSNNSNTIGLAAMRGENARCVLFELGTYCSSVSCISPFEITQMIKHTRMHKQVRTDLKSSNLSAVITVDVFCLVQFCLKWTT